MIKGKIYRNKKASVHNSTKIDQTKLINRCVSQPSLQNTTLANTTKFPIQNVEMHGSFNQSLNMQSNMYSTTAIDHLLQIQKRLKDRLIGVQRRHQMMVNHLQCTIQQKDYLIKQLRQALKQKDKIIQELQQQVLQTCRINKYSRRHH